MRQLPCARGVYDHTGLRSERIKIPRGDFLGTRGDFDHLICVKIIEAVATGCQILGLKCTKFNFGCCSAPDPAGGAYSAPPDPL